MKFIYNDKEKQRVIYLGYDMKLTRKEYKIYSYIEKRKGEYVSSDEIIRECYPQRKPKKGNIAAHICHINKKGYNISRRTLIISKYNIGYKMTDKP